MSTLKKLLVVLTVLAILVAGLGVGMVSADEPETVGLEQQVAITDEGTVVLDGAIITDFVETAVTTDENGTPPCEDWCAGLNCKIPCKRLQVTQRPIAHWQGFRCVVPEGTQEPVCVSSICGPCPGDEPTVRLTSWYAGSLNSFGRGEKLRNTGVVLVGGAGNNVGIFVVRASELKGVPTVEDVLATLNNMSWTIEDEAVANIKVDLLFLGWSRNWEDWTYDTWVALHSHISGTIARIDTGYIQEYMMPGDDLEVESLELRALVARVADDVKAYAQLSSTPAWVAIRVTLEGSSEDVSVQFGSHEDRAKAEISIWN